VVSNSIYITFIQPHLGTRMKKKIVIFVIIAIAIGIPVSKRYLSSDDIKSVSIEALSKQRIKASILASGQLKHEQEVKLSAEVIGKVTKLFVEEGDRVIKGQQVLQIDDESYVAAVQQQNAAVEQQKIAIKRQQLVVANLKQQWQRKADLFNQNLIDKDSYESMTNSYEVAKVDLKSSKELLKQVTARLDQTLDQLSKTKVISPIDGLITSLDIKEGETAISGTTNIMGSSLMTIANPNSMLAEINVDEADIANVAVGQKAEIISIAFANKPIEGVVESIASSAKRTQGRQSLSFAVKLKLNKDRAINLRPGMSCRAEVFTQGEQEKLAIPIKALRIKEDNENELVENFVFLYADNKVSKVKVEVGISDDDHQEIIEGISLGDQIVVGPDKILRHLKDGEAVNIEESDSEKPSDNETSAKSGN